VCVWGGGGYICTWVGIHRVIISPRSPPPRTHPNQYSTPPPKCTHTTAPNQHSPTHPHLPPTRTKTQSRPPRLDAVEELVGDLSPEADAIRAALKRMPDLERQLARHHALGSVHRR
jgi:hypothetical protein